MISTTRTIKILPPAKKFREGIEEFRQRYELPEGPVLAHELGHVALAPLKNGKRQYHSIRFLGELKAPVDQVYIKAAVNGADNPTKQKIKDTLNIFQELHQQSVSDHLLKTTKRSEETLGPNNQFVLLPSEITDSTGRTRQLSSASTTAFQLSPEHRDTLAKTMMQRTEERMAQERIANGDPFSDGDLSEFQKRYFFD